MIFWVVVADVNFSHMAFYLMQTSDSIMQVGANVSVWDVDHHLLGRDICTNPQGGAQHQICADKDVSRCADEHD